MKKLLNIVKNTEQIKNESIILSRSKELQKNHEKSFVNECLTKNDLCSPVAINCHYINITQIKLLENKSNQVVCPNLNRKYFDYTKPSTLYSSKKAATGKFLCQKHDQQLFNIIDNKFDTTNPNWVLQIFNRALLFYQSINKSEVDFWSKLLDARRWKIKTQ